MCCDIKSAAIFKSGGWNEHHKSAIYNKTPKTKHPQSRRSSFVYSSKLSKTKELNTVVIIPLQLFRPLNS